jgi:hypothetical protein
MIEQGEVILNRGYSARRARWLLSCGAGTGVALAAAGVLFKPSVQLAASTTAEPETNISQSLPIGIVARVNGKVIRERDFLEVLGREVSGGISPDSAQKQKILDGMIDEELRIQRAISLGLHFTDARVRMDLASAVAEAAVAKAEQESPNEATLRAYFDERRDYFRKRGPLRVRSIWIGIIAGNLGEAYIRARTATNLLREREAFDIVRTVVAGSDDHPIPDKLISANDLAAYIGPEALSVVLLMEPRQVSEPIRATDGFYVIEVLERYLSEVESFEYLRLDVEAEYWRDRTRRALEDNTRELRDAATILRAESL